MTLNREDEVRARLRTIASSLELKMPQAQLLLCQERFLARLSSLADGRAFIWKGGSLMLRLYRSLPAPRFTVDIDLLVKGRPVTDVPGILQRAMMHNLDDGFTFKGIVPEPMTRDTPYGGDRFSVGWTFFRKNSSQQLKIDVCAGDVVKSHRVQASDVFLLKTDEELSFNVYPPEFIFAEKLETAVRFGTGNSRFKDFVDMWSLIQLKLNAAEVKTAVITCFSNRGTACSAGSIESFITDDEFMSLMEQVRTKSFSQLALPPVPTIFNDLLRFINGLGLHD